MSINLGSSFVSSTWRNMEDMWNREQSLGNWKFWSLFYRNNMFSVQNIQVPVKLSKFQSEPCQYYLYFSIIIYMSVVNKKKWVQTFSMHSSKKAMLASLSDTNDRSEIKLMNVWVLIICWKNFRLALSLLLKNPAQR